MQAPAFWYDAAQEKKDWRARLTARLLAPAGRVYAWAVRQRFDFYYPVPLARPVVCVGNLVTGGAGKTPVVLSLVGLLQDAGYNPHILTRGYGGTEPGPLQVSPGRDTAADVGDEALLLVESAPTWVSQNRPLGAQAAIDSGATLIIMDDGFQNPSIYKDAALLVIDGASGFGNGKPMPAGPLRENVADGLSRADAVVIIGEDKAGVAEKVAAIDPAMPVLRASVKPDAGNPPLFGKPVFGFAGIGRPEKFRDTLIAAGAMLEDWKSFPDHYAYGVDDLKDFIDAARKKNALVVTTAKDYVRVPEALRESVQKFTVSLVWQEPAAALRLIENCLQKSPL
ncbi:MAG: tetraacyldisaccharide 4'-kinase [Alphaproteobacteria bacterium]|nr:tetraacyldisaccharide 4'-kinase [Alphaproteobacteria bacterium]